MDMRVFPIDLLSAAPQAMSSIERLKIASEGLFFVDDGATKKPFALALDDLTHGDADAISDPAEEIAKHFGIYQQRARNDSGRKSGDFIFMVRVKLPAGGELARGQWEALNLAAERYGNGTLRLTSRQGVQFHFVYGRHLAALIRHLNTEYSDNGVKMTTLGACGDVNRNTMCSPIDDLDAEMPLDSRRLARAIADDLAPRSSAYFQIFLADETGRTIAPISNDEPFYGAQYLPRKFKVGIAHPHDNSVDILTQDVGFLPRPENAAINYDLYTGGGLGITHNQPQTQQLLGAYLGRIPEEQVVAAVRAIALLQKENGERKDRRQARWKYTLRRMGIDTIKAALRERFAIPLAEIEPQPLPPIAYFHGWHREAGGADRYYFGLPIESGRLHDTPQIRMRSAVRRIVAELDLGLRITPNQDLLLCHIRNDCRVRVEALLQEHGVPLPNAISTVRRQALACPAKPTCGQAMTEAERLLPHYLNAIEQAGLGDIDVIIRMAGCPNSCSRPPTAEIGICGYGKNDYVIQVGGSRNGTRIGKVLYERVPGERMIDVLLRLLQTIHNDKPQNVTVGDYLYATATEELRRRIDP